MDLRATLESLRKLVDTHDPAQVAQAVELALSLNDAALFDAMLAGAHWELSTVRGEELPRLAPGDFFEADDAAQQPLNDHGLRLLLSRIPAWHEGAAELRLSVSALSLLADGLDLGATLDLDPLRAFTNVKALEIRGFSSILGISALRDLYRLETLTIRDGALPEGVGDLSHLTSLERLTVSATMPTIGKLGDAPRLRALDLGDCGALHSLDGITSLKAIEDLTLVNAPHLQTLEPLGNLTTLQKLTINSFSHPKFTSLRGIERNHGLREVMLAGLSALNSLDALAGMQSLHTLSIYYASSLASLEALAGCPRLKRVWLSDLTITSLNGLQHGAIESISVSSCPKLRSLESLRGSSALVSLNGHQLAQLTSLDGLEDQRELQSVHLSNAPSLESLSAMRALDKIASFALEGRHALTSLDGLQNKPLLTTLTLPECHRLTDVSALAGGAALKHLEILGAVALTDVSALASLTSLETLDLYGASSLEDVSALAASPTLKALSLGGTLVKRAKLPARLKPIVTLAKERNLRAMAARGPKERERAQTPEAVTKDTKKNYQRVKKLLLSRDIAQVDEGLELASSLGEASIFDGLLEDVSYRETLRRSPHKEHESIPVGGMFKPNDLFEVPGPGVVLRDRALVGLIARAPADSAIGTALKNKATKLELDGTLKHPSNAPIDLSPLPAFKHLRGLTVNNALEVQHPEAMGALSSLLNLTFLSCAPTDLSSLRDHPTLQSLHVSQRYGVDHSITSGLERLPALKRLLLQGDPVTRSFTLRDMGQLEEAYFYGMEALEELRIERCPSLKSLDLTYSGALRALDVSGCEALTLLTTNTSVPLQEIRGVGGLSQLDKLVLVTPTRFPFTAGDAAALTSLKTLVVWGCPKLTDTAVLAGLRSLEMLRLRDCLDLTDVSGLNALSHLHSVTLDGCKNLHDVSALEALPALKYLDLTGSGVDPAALPPALRAVLA